MPEEFPDFDPSEYDIDVEDNREHIGFTGMKKKDIEKRIEELKEKRRIALEEKAEENAVSDENADTSSAIFDAETEESSENEDKRDN